MNFDEFSIEAICDAGKKFGTPFYFYDLDILKRNIGKLKTAASGFKIRYAVKTNPNPFILRWLKDHVDSLDVSSSGEINHASKNGWLGEDMEFTGPAKKNSDLKLALDLNVKSIVIEDLGEAVALNKLAEDRGLVARVLIRIAPSLAEENFGVRLAGRPTQFGIDQDKLPEVFAELRQLSNIRVAGFHIYSGSQCLNDESIATHFGNMWSIFKQAIHDWGAPIDELVFGAGMGIPYHDGDNALKLDHLPEVAESIIEDVRSISDEIDCHIEVGRFLIGTAGLFVTEVVRVKESKNSNIAICDGGMNNNLGACGHLGGISHRHYSMLNVTGQSGEKEKYRVVGPLCTAIDTLAHRVMLPKVSEGDLIAVGCSGSYGPTASPLFFIAHDLPREVVFTESEGRESKFEDATWIKHSF
ncbi:alanine racemase [Microbulbifer sp. SA54]|uniref:alanine racemase n=1 Tax=Microbulbifer sp. SA54 TaxID=3401577 RepID=UPI003AAC5695